MNIKDMIKIESPFKRKMIDGIYVVTPEIEEGYEWVFEGKEDEVLCTEKLDGTDVSIIIQDGSIVSVWNRTERIPFFNKGKKFIIEAVLNSYERGYCNLTDGQYFGEVIGSKLQNNPYKLDEHEHLWIPFNSYCREHLAYKSYHKYPKTFENISEWFRLPIAEGGIFSLFMRRKHIEQKPEGVVFHNLKTGQMAKLRLDMFDWHKGRRHKIKENEKR